MEIEGHPTHDLIKELEERGAIRAAGTGEGPFPDGLRFVTERTGDQPGFWLFLPREAFETGFDEIPS